MIFDDFSYGGASLDDPGFTGSVIADYSSTVTRSRDGFLDGEVVADLWVTEVTLAGEVIRLDDTGGIAITTTPVVDILSEVGEPGLRGLAQYTLTGFGGFTVDLDYLGDPDIDFPFVPTISRSGNGEAIIFDYTVGGLTSLEFGVGDTYILRTNAPSFRLDAVSEVDVAIPTFGVETLDAGGVAATAIPLPPSLALMGGALALMAAFRRRR